MKLVKFKHKKMEEAMRVMRQELEFNFDMELWAAVAHPVYSILAGGEGLGNQDSLFDKFKKVG